MLLVFVPKENSFKLSIVGAFHVVIQDYTFWTQLLNMYTQKI